MLRRHQRLASAGSVHFVTTVTSERGKWFIQPSVCKGLLTAFEKARLEMEVLCLGYVLMPDHLHALLLQDRDGTVIAELMRRFKRNTSTTFHPVNYPATSLWQRRYDDVPVPGSKAVWTKLNYIHQNPVKRALSAVAEAYPYSSARDFMGFPNGIVTIATEMVAPLMR